MGRNRRPVHQIGRGLDLISQAGPPGQLENEGAGRGLEPQPAAMGEFGRPEARDGNRIPPRTSALARRHSH